MFTHLKNPMNAVKITMNHFSCFVNLGTSSECKTGTDGSIGASVSVPSYMTPTSRCLLGESLRMLMGPRGGLDERAHLICSLKLVACEKTKNKNKEIVKNEIFTERE